MVRIVIGNLISLAASVFLCLGGLVRSKKNIYFFQFLECLFLIISQLVFLQIAGAVSMLFGAIRNLVAAKDGYSLQLMVFTFISIGVFGIAMNTGGVIGLIPVLASLFLTVTAYKLRDVIKIRIAVMINLLMWVVYSFIILDVVTGLTNTVALGLNAYTLIKELRYRTKSEA